MHCLPLALAILATAVAHPAPAYESGHGPAWIAAAGSTAKCESNSTLTVSFNQGPPQQTVLDNACAAMLPSCAYPERRGNDTACVQTFEYGLNAPASSIQSANVLENGDKSLKWSVKCESVSSIHSGRILMLFSFGDSTSSRFLNSSQLEQGRLLRLLHTARW